MGLKDEGSQDEEGGHAEAKHFVGTSHGEGTNVSTKVCVIGKDSGRECVDDGEKAELRKRATFKGIFNRVRKHTILARITVHARDQTRWEGGSSESIVS